MCHIVKIRTHFSEYHFKPFILAQIGLGRPTQEHELHRYLDDALHFSRCGREAHWGATKAAAQVKDVKPKLHASTYKTLQPPSVNLQKEAKIEQKVPSEVQLAGLWLPQFSYFLCILAAQFYRGQSRDVCVILTQYVGLKCNTVNQMNFYFQTLV
jgi:hypothetical protein